LQYATRTRSAAALPRVALDCGIVDGGGHAVLRPQRLDDAHVGEEELDDAHVLYLYGVLDGGVAAIVDDRGVAPVLEEVGHLIVAATDGPDDGGVAVIANISRMIAWV
jgi:hypothetical protein